MTCDLTKEPVKPVAGVFVFADVIEIKLCAVVIAPAAPTVFLILKSTFQTPIVTDDIVTNVVGVFEAKVGVEIPVPMVCK